MIFHTRSMRHLRALRKTSITDVSHAAGVSPGYLRRLERGERTPTPDVIEALARALDAEPEDLAVDPSVEQLIRELIRKLDGSRDRMTVAIDILTQLRDAS